MKSSRRKFVLGLSSLGLTAYSSNIAFSVEDNIPKCNQNNNSVIYLFLSGGPTHIETFNPIPHATSDRIYLIR